MKATQQMIFRTLAWSALAVVAVLGSVVLVLYFVVGLRGGIVKTSCRESGKGGRRWYMFLLLDMRARPTASSYEVPCSLREAARRKQASLPISTARRQARQAPSEAQPAGSVEDPGDFPGLQRVVRPPACLPTSTGHGLHLFRFRGSLSQTM
jgi:hypothetical protein